MASGTLDIENTQRRVFTITLHKASRKSNYAFPPIRLSMTQEQGFPFLYEIKKSIPKISDTIIRHPFSKISIDGEAGGYMVLTKSSDISALESPPLSITWGMWNDTEPWCRIQPFRGEELETEWMSIVFDEENSYGPQLSGHLMIPAYRLIPREIRRFLYDPMEGHSNVFVADRKFDTLHSGGYPAHTITARIRLNTLWGQSRLELEPTVKMI